MIQYQFMINYVTALTEQSTEQVSEAFVKRQLN